MVYAKRSRVMFVPLPGSGRRNRPELVTIFGMGQPGVGFNRYWVARDADSRVYLVDGYLLMPPDVYQYGIAVRRGTSARAI